MKNGNDFRVQMIRVMDDLAPFVEVGYVDQDANEHTALMVVDSCSNKNVLFGSRAEKNGVVLQREEGTIDIKGAGNEMVTTSLAKFHFVLGGEKFHESFCINDVDIQIPSEIDGKAIIGILGNLFMQEHNLVIDYRDFMLHNSNVNSENLPISDCDFFFPMEIGLESYGLPILAIRQNGNDLVAIADTGATNNMIASPTIEENGFDCQYLGTTDTVAGIAGETDVMNARMKFCLLTLTDSSTSTDVVEHEDYFKVTSQYMLIPEEGECDENGEKLPPIVGIIGSPFMARQNWVLDFGAKIIYRLKDSKAMNFDVRVKNRIVSKQGDDGHQGNRRIQFYADVLKKGRPFIHVKDGDFKDVVFLINTGSSGNTLFDYAYQQLKDVLTEEEGKSDIMGMDGTITSLKKVSGKISFCGKEHPIMFNIKKDDKAIIKLSLKMGFPIAGIIGTSFMAELGWLIDFGRQEIVIPAYTVTSADLNDVRNSKK